MPFKFLLLLLICSSVCLSYSHISDDFPLPDTTPIGIEEPDFINANPNCLMEVPNPASLRSRNNFTHPALASKVIGQLEVVEPRKKNPNNPASKYKVRYDQLEFERLLIKDDKYCEKHRAYYVEHPEIIFDQVNFVSELPFNSFVRKDFLRSVGHDLKTNFRTDDSFLKLSRKTNFYFTKNQLFNSQKIGKSYSCLSQASNHIDGNAVLEMKNFVAEATASYITKYRDQPGCITKNQYCKWPLNSDLLGLFPKFSF